MRFVIPHPLQGLPCDGSDAGSRGRGKRQKSSLLCRRHGTLDTSFRWYDNVIVLCCFGIILCLFTGSALAQGVSDDALHSTLQSLKTSKAREQELKAKGKVLEQDLLALQKETVTLAETMRRDERALAALEYKLGILQKEQQQKRDAYAMRKRQLGAAIGGMVRLSQTPVEAVVALPGDARHTIRTAQMLAVATKAIRQEADSLKLQLTELRALEDKVATNREAVTKEKQQLETAQEKLAGRLEERKLMQATLYQEQKQAGIMVARLSEKSRSLKELLDNIEEEEAKRQPPPAAYVQETEVASLTPAPARHSKRALRPFASARGAIPIPVTGTLVSHFGDNKGDGDRYKGITLKTRAGASVISPFDGEVVFTGNFLDYGKLVIIRHAGGFHTLLAGLEKIDCAPGQFLLEGEPIGAMGRGQSSTEKLYVELRKSGKPIDPAPWIKGL